MHTGLGPGRVLGTVLEFCLFQWSDGLISAFINVGSKAQDEGESVANVRVRDILPQPEAPFAPFSLFSSWEYARAVVQILILYY